jgi:alpha-amylase/alpha-mannosidase (GH57 family)
MTQVAILWHMHQPYYEDLVTHEHILPWVRLHALKDYYGMVALLREFPAVKMTFNLVPSLLVQLEAFAADRAVDRYLELSVKAADALSDADVDFMLDNFFHAQRAHMIDAHPRYGELLARRGAVMNAADRRAVARRFDRGDLRDLQVWQKLAWIDPGYVDTDERVRHLVGKGRDFSEDDKSLLRQVELELLNAVIPEYRSAAERGQIEISTSPFFHPILPLLCDTDVYLQTHPESPMPRQRFQHPEDASEQLERAAACHERLFGQRPRGLWPSEGSVSDAIIPLVSEAGFEWIATDELILERTLAMHAPSDAGTGDRASRLYRPYDITVRDGSVACAFRDHHLSDLIGFVYAAWPAAQAADDFVNHLVEAGRRYRDETGGEEGTIFVILDGENAWEHFEGGGRPFLRALYSRLTSHPELRTVTMAEACSGARRPLPGIFPGSWIDANFYIWIGHADDRRAWSQLAAARDVLDGVRVDASRRAAAYEEILVAEGSDWCWWYGDDHSSEHDAEFDELFRRHLRNAYQLLDRPVPEELFVTNMTTAGVGAPVIEPAGRITPTIDGEDTSYFEWLGAGSFDVHDAAGAMHRADREPPLVTRLAFGFDARHLHLRIDACRPLAEILGEGREIMVTFLEPAAVITIRRDASGVRAAWRDARTDDVPVAAGTILELSIPLAALDVPGGRIAFTVGLRDHGGHETERHPPNHPIELAVAGAASHGSQWTA